MAVRGAFAPNVTWGQPVGVVNARFLVDAERWGLRYLCADCAHVGGDGRCSLGFPNERLWQQPFAAVDGQGVPQFCRCFEPDEG